MSGRSETGEGFAADPQTAADWRQYAEHRLHELVTWQARCRAAEAEVERLDRELAKLATKFAAVSVERDRLADLIRRQLGECIGCRYDDGPDEYCPHHGRTYEEWTEIVSAQQGRLNAVDELLDQARKVSPSPSMAIFVGELDRALGRDVDKPRGKVGASDV